MASGYVR